MTDTISAEQRSRNMAAIRSRNTGPEVYFRKQLFAQGFRYRLGEKSVPGHPDIFLRRYNTAVFIHGCFWHRHSGCRYAYTQKSRVEFWQRKFAANLERDQIVREELKAAGIRRLVIWECTVNAMMKAPAFCEDVIAMASTFLKSDAQELEL